MATDQWRAALEKWEDPRIKRPLFERWAVFLILAAYLVAIF